MRIKAEELAKKISDEMHDFKDEKIENMKKLIDETAKETQKQLKQTSPKRTGKYAKDWSKETVFENALKKRVTVFNKKTYRLTHLLEKGHAKRGGGRVAAIPHIKKAEEAAIETIEKKVDQI